jgi:hypothetical protein
MDMGRTKYIPSIVMLAAAFVACVSTIYFKYTTEQIVYIVLLTSVCFFILGQIIRMIVEKHLVVETIVEMNEGSEGEESENKEQKEEETVNSK